MQYFGQRSYTSHTVGSWVGVSGEGRGHVTRHGVKLQRGVMLCNGIGASERTKIGRSAPY